MELSFVSDICWYASFWRRFFYYRFTDRKTELQKGKFTSKLNAALNL